MSKSLGHTRREIRVVASKSTLAAPMRLKPTRIKRSQGNTVGGLRRCGCLECNPRDTLMDFMQVGIDMRRGIDEPAGVAQRLCPVLRGEGIRLRRRAGRIMFAGSQFIRLCHDAIASICQDFLQSGEDMFAGLSFLDQRCQEGL